MSFINYSQILGVNNNSIQGSHVNYTNEKILNHNVPMVSNINNVDFDTRHALVYNIPAHNNHTNYISNNSKFNSVNTFNSDVIEYSMGNTPNFNANSQFVDNNNNPLLLLSNKNKTSRVVNNMNNRRSLQDFIHSPPNSSPLDKDSSRFVYVNSINNFNTNFDKKSLPHINYVQNNFDGYNTNGNNLKYRQTTNNSSFPLNEIQNNNITQNNQNQLFFNPGSLASLVSINDETLLNYDPSNLGSSYNTVNNNQFQSPIVQPDQLQRTTENLKINNKNTENSSEIKKIPKSRGRRVVNKNDCLKNPELVGRNFVCEIDNCHKVFKRSEHLKRHVRSIHTKEKPFQCPFLNCLKRFSRSDNLNQHIKTHKHNNNTKNNTNSNSYNNWTYNNIHDNNLNTFSNINNQQSRLCQIKVDNNIMPLPNTNLNNEFENVDRHNTL